MGVTMVHGFVFFGGGGGIKGKRIGGKRIKEGGWNDEKINKR